MENITLTDFQTAIVVLLAILSALAMIDKGVSAFKNLFFKGSNGMEKRIQTIEEKQTRDYNRINDMDKKLRHIDDDMEHVLNAINAILMHEITGNGVERMRESKNDLDSYMSKRGMNARSKTGD